MANLSNINNKFLVTTGGNVLIGQTAVVGTSMLQVEGSTNAIIRMNSTSGTGGRMDFAHGGSNYGNIGSARNMLGVGNASDMMVNGDSILYLGVGAQHMTILSSGNVGIGTTSPSSKLHVTGAPANGVYLSYLYNSATHNSANGLNVQTSSNNILTYGLRVNTAGDSNALAVMGNGSVGIGTASPGAKLEIKDGDLWLNGATSNYNPEIFFIDDAGPTSIAGAKIRYENNNGNLYFDHKWDTATSGFFFRNRVDGTALNTMSLVNGNVGIGMTAPNNLLNLQRNVAGGDVAAYIQNFNGDVGSTDETASVKFAHGNDGVVGYVGGKLVCGKEGDFETSIPNIKGNLQFYTASGTSLDSDVNNIERMRINGSGRTHIIGPALTLTSETTYGLSVSSQTDATKVVVVGYDNSADVGVIQAVDIAVAWKNLSLCPTSGNVGIGTTTPAAATKLEVAGGTKSTFYTSDGGRGFKQDGVAFVSTYSNGADANAANDIGSTTNRWRDGFFSGGVYLGGTAAANKLDDYEEGNWTCEPRGGTTAGTFSSPAGHQACTYTKIGRLVHVSIFLYATSFTGTGTFEIHTLPFAVVAYPGTMPVQANNPPWTLTVNNQNITAYPTGTKVQFRATNWQGGGGYITAQCGGSTTVGYIRINGVYQTS